MDQVLKILHNFIKFIIIRVELLYQFNVFQYLINSWIRHDLLFVYVQNSLKNYR